MNYAYKAKQIGPIIYGLSIGDKLKLTGSATVEATAEIENAENGIATWKAVSFNSAGESYVTAQNAAVRVTATTDCTLTVTEGTERELTEYRVGTEVTSAGKGVSAVSDPITGGIGFSVGGRIVAPQNIRDRFFASIPNGDAYRKQKALLAPPAWVASTIYGTGSVVQNGGNVYFCQNSFGASASSGGPLTAVSTPITDGAIKWLYMGPVDSTTADQSDAPTVTFGATHASTTRRYDPTISADAAAFWFTGSAYGPQVPWGGGTGVGSNVQNSMFSVDFVTDAPVVSFSSHSNFANSGINDANPFTALINGVPLHRVGGTQPGTNLTPGGIILDFAARPRKARRIRAYMSNKVFTGVSIPPAYSVWRPTNPHRYRLAVEGDSTTQGASPANSAAANMRAARLASMLGCDDVWSFAVGSTGFLNAGGGSTVLSRAASVIASAPDILYVAPINNDVGNDVTYNSATRRSAYKQYFDTILSALPGCIIICGGGYATTAANLTTSADSAWQVEADMATAIAVYNHPHVKFLPSVSDPAGRWLLGDGHVGTTANSAHGNSDWMIGDGSDSLHPNQRFLEYVMWREYYGIVSIMNGID